jgi:hypothetical protein
MTKKEGPNGRSLSRLVGVTDTLFIGYLSSERLVILQLILLSLFHLFLASLVLFKNLPFHVTDLAAPRWKHLSP